MSTQSPNPIELQRRPTGGSFASRRFPTRRVQSARVLTTRRRRTADRQGATLVEFALVCNVFFITIFTCMEFARMNMARNMAQDAAYYAARVAIVPGATTSEAVAEADRIMQSMFSSGYTVDVTPLDEDSDEVTVTVGVSLDEVALFMPMFMGGVELESSATMQTERYSGFFEQ